MKNARLERRLHRVHALPSLGIVDSTPTANTWPSNLGEPTNPLAMTLAVRAHSILHGSVRDASGLSLEQARDVIAWHERHLAATNPKPRSWLQRLFRH